MLSTKSKLRLTGAFATLVTLALASCQGFFPHKTITAITVDPPAPSVGVGNAQQMVANATFDDNSQGSLSSGTSCSNNSVCWTESSGGTVISITSAGLVTGVAIGTSTVTATSGSISGNTTVTVILSNVTGVTLDQSSGYTIPTTTGTTTAKAFAETSNGKVDISASANWNTGSSTVATVVGGTDPVVITGAGTAGVTTVTATYAGFTATANVTVE